MQRMNERGATFVVMAVMMVLFLAMAALAIDLSMLYDSRAEAQKAADAAALAGASAFIDAPQAPLVPAHDRAMGYAQRNRIRGVAIDTTREVTVTLAQDTVEVLVRRDTVGTWFAKIFGVRSARISARATAVASPASGVSCLAPVAIPDLWSETSPTQDLNSNQVWESTEAWDFEPSLGDWYAQWTAASTGPTSGYGGPYRNGTGVINDYGRQILIKAQSPTQSLTSGFFYPWQIGGASGAQAYRNSWLVCNPAGADIGVAYDIETGNMVGPTRQAINSLVATDPNATWDPGSNTVINSAYGTNWIQSPRVVTVALFDPNQIAGIQGGGNLQLTFNNFARMFVEGMQGNGVQAPVVARFVYYANGRSAGPGTTTGSLVKMLQLVK